MSAVLSAGRWRAAVMDFGLALDPATDARIRADWAALLDAGLPSQARHRSASNAPHVTLLAATTVEAELRPDVVPDPGPDAVPSPALPHPLLPSPLLPIPLNISGLAVFGAPPRGLVLARLVAVSGPLQALHASVHRRASGVTGLSPLTTPDHWTPHITLASRLTPAQLAEALQVLAAHAAAAEAAAAAAAVDAAAVLDATAAPHSTSVVDAMAVPDATAVPDAPVADATDARKTGVAGSDSGFCARATSIRHWNGSTKTLTIVPL